MRSLHISLKTALLLALFATLALAISVAGLAMVDRDARRIAAGEAALNDLTALDAKLPGVLDEPSAEPLIAAAIAEIGRYAGETSQPRVALFRSANGVVRGTWPRWPTIIEPYDDRFARVIAPDGAVVVGVMRSLPSGASMLIARPVAPNSPLRRSLGWWGVATAALLIGLAVSTAMIVGGHAARRIGRLNAVCARVERGDVAARIEDMGATDELGLLAQHMNNMLEELERRLEALRQASDHIAHDLRTPLTRVRTRLAAIATQSGDLGQEVGLALEEIDRLMEAFNGLLDLREIETDIAPPMPFEVADAVEDAIELYEAVAEDQKGVRIERLVQPGTFIGHRALVIRALANLIDNALKAAPEQSMISVSATIVPQRVGLCLELTVADQGQGFPVVGRARSTLDGYGIGLNIVRAIAKRHQGEIAIDDCRFGAVVRLTLRAPLPTDERQES